MTRAQGFLIGAAFAAAALALALRLAGVEGQVVFIVAGVAVAGLAWVLGLATEQAGESAGPRVSALLNASFGNLPELVILVLAINAGLSDIARASIIGSVIGNILLILGLSLLLGGWRHGIQRFNERMAGTNALDADPGRGRPRHPDAVLTPSTRPSPRAAAVAVDSRGTCF